VCGRRVWSSARFDFQGMCVKPRVHMARTAIL
jgi:hypothetical protein